MHTHTHTITNIKAWADFISDTVTLRKATMTISIWQQGVIWEQRLHMVNYAYANSLQCHMQCFLKWFQYDNLAASWQNQRNDLCTQWRLRSAAASTQSDQTFRCPPEATLAPKLPVECTAQTLIRLAECPGWSVSSFGTKVILLVLSWGGSKC